MKRHMLFVMLALLVATTAMAGEICVYWDEAGTIQDASQIESGNEPLPLYTGYVIIFVEDIVQGASYSLELVGTEAAVFGQDFTDGLQIGDAFAGGIEVGLTDKQYGFSAMPVIIQSVTLLNTVYPAPAHVELFVTPHPAYGSAVYADGEEVIHSLGICQGAVSNEEGTFSEMKSLYR